jgi:hypothetical protein
MVPLLKVQKLFQLGVEQNHKLVMAMKGGVEFTPHDMVISR